MIDCVPGVKPERNPLSRRVTLQNPTEPLVNAVQAPPQTFWVREEQKVTMVTCAERGARGLGGPMKGCGSTQRLNTRKKRKQRLRGRRK
ncbi:hypothetical protein TRAPUB_2885 [Trametes pubescens]|uniref:Uncharacterized protein n=1 Tax=Trametes pubescens TaxID=154538 RepID=A0A1M2VF83_TRAPU|nr:hypothetical protein TRAPUB_2885 [Trametes pubescens]